jgi:internalin A
MLPSALQPKALLPWNGYLLRWHNLGATRRLASPFARLPGPADAARTSLNLSSIGLASLPSDDVAHYAALRTLDLGSNRLVAAPNGVALLPALETLSLRNNDLQRLPAAWLRLVGERCARLRVLVLAHNELSTLPDEIACLGALCKLNLADNALSSLPAALARLTTLQHCNVSGNRLSPTAALALGPATRLTSLDL